MDPEFVRGLLRDFLKENCLALEFVFLYGSRKRDLDIFVVTESETDYISPIEFKSGKIVADISLISSAEFRKRIQFFEPLVTEPLLTGEIIEGRTDSVKTLRDYAASRRLAMEELKSLCRESIRWIVEGRFLLEACLFKQRGHKMSKVDTLQQYVIAAVDPPDVLETGKDLMDAIIDLCFAATYSQFLKYYSTANSSGPITLSELVKRYSDGVFIEFMKFKHAALHERQNLVVEDVNRAIDILIRDLRDDARLLDEGFVSS